MSLIRALFCFLVGRNVGPGNQHDLIQLVSVNAIGDKCGAKLRFGAPVWTWGARQEIGRLAPKRAGQSFQCGLGIIDEPILKLRNGPRGRADRFRQLLLRHLPMLPPLTDEVRGPFGLYG